MNIIFNNDEKVAQVHPLVFSHDLVSGASKTFKHSFEIFLKDSNAYANTYFARYFEWQGVCREKWFHDCISQDMLQTQGIFITKRAHQEYERETFPFEKIDCELNVFNVRMCSFYLLFNFSSNGKHVSRGYQQIVFANHNKKIVRLPDEIIKKIKEYEVDKNIVL